MNNTSESSENMDQFVESEHDSVHSHNTNETDDSNTSVELPPIIIPTSNGSISFSFRPPPPPPPPPPPGEGQSLHRSRRLLEPIIISGNQLTQGGGAASIGSYQFYNIGTFPIGGSGHAPSGVLNQSLYDNDAYKNVLSDKGKKMINYRKYMKDDDVKHCPIMFTDFEEGEEIAELPCHHIFDKDAIVKWLEEQDASCPVCRKKLDSKEVKNEEEEQGAPSLPTFSQLINSFRELARERITLIDEAEDRMLQMAIEESLKD